MAKALFSDAIDGYLDFCAATGLAKSTVANRAGLMRHALKVVGNIYVNNIEQRHIVKIFADAGKKRGQNSLVNTHTALKTFFKWAARQKYLGSIDDPMIGYPRPKPTGRARLRVPLDQFPALLDAARTPRDRMLIALGIYLLGRKTELTDIRIGELNLSTGFVETYQSKTRSSDSMPICEELDEELRPYLIWYQEMCGPLNPDWFLIPGFSRPYYKGPLHVPGTYQPTYHPCDAAGIVQWSLKELGFPLRDPVTGKSNNEGMHTLRRSGARAVFDECRKMGHDGALRHVQALLHHKTMKQTEEYIGLSYDVQARNERVRGKRLYPSLAAANVVTLESRREAEGIAS